MNGRILVCDPIAEDGIALLKRLGAEVDVRTGLSREELLQAVDGYDALIVRSETRLTREIIEAAKKLQVIGRAGIGVDNIDVPAATEKGVVVVNAPTGNVISAAEHAIALMLALARHIPDANASLKSGKWERKRFLGLEVRGKTLGIIGLGQVGSEVARRARGLEMRVVAHDPFVPEERARALGVDLVAFDQLLRESDFLTVHTTLTEGTRHLIGKAEMAQMKPTARIINTARGGIVDEADLNAALKAGKLAGAALDVFETEPLTSHPLFQNERVIVTPHLGASTTEAQERVAVDVAEQVIAVIKGEPAQYAVNAPLISPETYSYLAPYIPVAFKTGSLAVQLCEGQMEEIEIDYSGEIAQHNLTPLKAAIVGGLLAPISEEHVNVVNVDVITARRGMRISERRGPSHEIYANLITVAISTTAGQTKVSGTLAHDGPHVVLIDDFWVDIPPGEGYLLVCENRDRPGMVGAIGTLLGKFDVNISFMNVGRHEKRGTALMVLTLDEAVTPEHLDEVRKIPDILSAKLVRL
ncbi:MAG TPA: phosphoglycerate dehydrogenase [Dehalococcoidia bacterium]|nr:phosphoglycerate dehydrogenase [Dehalococcoidia bacterium]